MNRTQPGPVSYTHLLRYGLKNELRKEDVLLCAFVVILFGSVLTVLFTPLFRFYPAVSNWKWYICAYVVAYMVKMCIRDREKRLREYKIKRKRRRRKGRQGKQKQRKRRLGKQRRKKMRGRKQRLRK